MKYALSLFILLTITTLSNSASARTITSFEESDAISTVAQFMSDVAEDIPVAGAKISDRKVKVADLSVCVTVKSTDVVTAVESAIKRVLRYYPDEDLPFEQALVDLEDYLDNQTYKKCTFDKKSSQAQTSTTYYVDSSDKIHLRLDNVALLAE